jgi:hypothetical protein
MPVKTTLEHFLWDLKAIEQVRKLGGDDVTCWRSRLEQ